MCLTDLGSFSVSPLHIRLISYEIRTWCCVEKGAVTKNGGFFYYPDEAMYHRDRGHIILECGQITLKVIDQRRSAIRTGPSGSDNPAYVAHGLALLNEIRTWCVVREGRCHKKDGFFLNQYC